MPRGRHRHAQPLHRMAGPAVAAAVAVGCAAAAWLVGDRPAVLRLLPAGAALAAVTAAVLLRRWDRYAGRRVSEADARRAGAEWRAEERQAELEEQLDEAREQRRTAERRLRAKRDELTRLRTEHAALLRRYATAETERASALEGRRQLAIEAAEPARAALTSVAADHRDPSGAPTPLTYAQADEALGRLRHSAEQQEAAARQEEETPPSVLPAVRPDGRPAVRPDRTPAVRPDGEAAVRPDAAPAVRPDGTPARRPKVPGSGFDYFGNRRSPQQPAPQRRGPQTAEKETETPSSDEEGDRGPVPALQPPTRRSPAAAAGQVIDLAMDDSGALDITELRDAAS